MLNLFQHLVVSMGYETLKQVQGDIPAIYTQTLTSLNYVTRTNGPLSQSTTTPYPGRIDYSFLNRQNINAKIVKIYLDESMEKLMKKLLIVGNIQKFMTAGKNILNRADLKIFTATSGEEALDIHKTEKADLIITELDTPGMSGDKLCSIIRKDEGLKRVSIIIVCTSAASDILRVSRCKANSYITKPIQPEQLIASVAQLVNIPERKSYRVLLKVSVKGTSANGSSFCSSRDISATGILLQTDRTFAIGDVISCDFFLPDSSRIVTDVEIMRVTRNHDKTFHYGAKYVDISPKHKSAIMAFINKRSAGMN
jgi:CheY-like chemotaxis protein